MSSAGSSPRGGSRGRQRAPGLPCATPRAPPSPRGGANRQPHALLAGRHAVATQAVSGRGIFKSRAISPSKPSRRNTTTLTAALPPRCALTAEGTIRELEVGLRRTDAQPIRIFGAPLILGVVKMQEVRAGDGQRRPQPGIGVMRQFATGLVLEIVVEGQLPPGGIGQSQHAIQRRAESPGIDLADDRLSGAALESKHGPLAGVVDAAVHDHRQRDVLGMFGPVVGTSAAHSGRASSAKLGRPSNGGCGQVQRIRARATCPGHPA